jgi:hypothetical protein
MLLDKESGLEERLQAQKSAVQLTAASAGCTRRHWTLVGPVRLGTDVRPQGCVTGDAAGP